MNTQNFIADFIDFYLFPTHSSKSIALTQLKLLKKINSKNTDSFLETVFAIKSMVSALKKAKKNKTLLQPQGADLYQKAYLHITQLDPKDCLLLISKERYQLDDTTISLALKQSQQSLEFRRNQLLNHFQDEKVILPNFQKFDPKTITLIKPNQQLNPFQNFKKLPLLIRFSIETTVVLCILFLFMWLIPEMRNRYEQTIQKRINDYFIESSLYDSPAPTGTTKEPKAVISLETNTESDSETQELVTNSNLNNNKKQPKVVEGETWRFSFTGSLTNEIENGLLTILKKFPIEEAKPLTVPGGIQFDFNIGTHSLIDLKNALEEMSFQLQNRTQNKMDVANSNSLSLINMSWYKKKNMGTRKIPNGNVQVIIWISTL